MLSFELAKGSSVPGIGMGTWKVDSDSAETVIRCAIEIGYRHFDCAPVYRNEEAIGSALSSCIREGLVTREELWITSKLWNDAHGKADVRIALEETIEDLQLDYLDLFLMHWPVAHRKGVRIPMVSDDLISLEELPLSETWGAIEECQAIGLCRHIGVSNFNEKKLLSLTDAGHSMPEVNQVEVHPYLQQQRLVDFCQKNDVLVIAYSPLGSKDRFDIDKGSVELLEDPVISAIADEHSVTPAQVALVWSLMRGCAVIPKASDSHHLRENFISENFTLTEDSIDRLAELEKGLRYTDGQAWAIQGSSYSLDAIWGE